jgi:hypothetical protein
MTNQEMATEKGEGRIFISYASPDRSRVIPFYERLKSDGFNVWMDVKCLLPGQNWDFEIKRSLDKAAFVLMFVSNYSYQRRGYVQRELKIALDKLDEKLIDDIYLIPVCLDDEIELPDQIKGIQSIPATSRDCYGRIVESLRHQLEKLGTKLAETQEREGITWSFEQLKESWDGLPGYEVELRFINIESSEYTGLKEIGDFIRGQFVGQLFEHRSYKLSQSPESFSFAEGKFRRTNTYDAHCEDPIIVGKVLSLKYFVDWYGAGAAHPNYHFVTYVFLLEPLIRIGQLHQLFNDTSEAFLAIQNSVREQLYKVESGEPETPYLLDKEWVDNGTKEWGDFNSFIVKPSGIEISFAPYHVGPYAVGAHVVEVPKEVATPHLTRDFARAFYWAYQ